MSVFKATLVASLVLSGVSGVTIAHADTSPVSSGAPAQGLAGTLLSTALASESKNVSGGASGNDLIALITSDLEGTLVDTFSDGMTQADVNVAIDTALATPGNSKAVNAALRRLRREVASLLSGDRHPGSSGTSRWTSNIDYYHPAPSGGGSGYRKK